MISRRHTLSGAISLLLLPSAADAVAQAPAKLFQDTFGPRPITPGRVQLKLPGLAENGNSVRLSVAAPMQPTANQRLQFIQIFAPANPQPYIAKFSFGELAASGEVQTRIRVAADQAIAAVAGYSDGSLWSATADIVVTEAACLDALY